MYLAIACRGVLALVFLVSAASKLRGRAGFGAFEKSVRDLRLLPGSAVRPVSAVVALTELGVVPLLGLPATAIAGLVAGLAMLAGFSVAIVLALRRGTTASCRCFGHSSAPLGRRHVVRNAVLAAIALAGVVASAGPAGPLHPAGVAVALAAAAMVAVVVVTLDQLVDLFAGRPPAPAARR